jgi:hypothetical protein
MGLIVEGRFERVWMIFFGCGVLVFLLGFLRKTAVLVWCFCGEFVVECMVNVVVQPSYLLW